MAEETSRIAVDRSVEIDAEPAAVWEKIGRFGDMSWHPAVFSNENPGGDMVGAVRVLTLGAAGGPTITEELTTRSDEEMRYSYRILEVDPAVLPVLRYSSELSVAARLGSGCVVRWNGQFDPASGVDEAAAGSAIAGVYEGGLGALTAAFAG